MTGVRYIVSDIDAETQFFTDMLDFEVVKKADGFAALKRDDLTLFLNVPGAGSAGKAGGSPEPGGWNRFQLQTDDLDGRIEELRSKGAQFRGDVAEAPAGRQILLEDPSGNVIELFEPA